MTSCRTLLKLSVRVLIIVSSKAVPTVTTV
jgi:hypothetical protein